jgi:hypothetical protein
VLNRLWNFLFGTPFTIRVSPYRNPEEGNLVVPAWYGISWRDSQLAVTVMHPVPLNIVFRSIRELWFMARFPSTSFREWYEGEVRAHLASEASAFRAIQELEAVGEHVKASKLRQSLIETRGVWHGRKDRLTAEFRAWAVRQQGS